MADLAIGGLRRRRLTRIVAAAVAVPALAAALIVTWQWQREQPEPVTIDLTGHSVVAAYRDAGSWVLNPDTGEYVSRRTDLGMVSPDLRFPVHIAWSPDGTRLAGDPARRGRTLSHRGRVRR